MKPLPLISFLCFLLSISLSGQIRGKVIDKSTGLPIQFANIFIEGKPVGATTDLNGDFNIKTNTINESIIVSAIGYDSNKSKADTTTLVIHLIPKTYDLSEVIVKPKKYKTKQIIGAYNKNKIHSHFVCGGYPWVVTKYFEYKPDYNTTPYLKQIKILTSSSTHDSVIFNLRLLSANKDGSPGVDLLNKNLVAKSQLGVNKNTIIDLNSYNLTMPHSGLIIAVEWLILEQNKANWRNQLQYLPQFGSVTMEGESKTWNYVGGKWYRVTLVPPTEKNKYKELAAELTLTN